MLQILIDLCSKRSEEASIKLGSAIKAKTEAEQTLSMIEEYRQGYIEQVQQKLSNGIQSGDYNNFLKFISTLDKTITQQKLIVQSSVFPIERHRKDWQDSERKRLSYTTLTNRAEAALRLKENKLDQKQTDEFASRRRVNKY